MKSRMYVHCGCGCKNIFPIRRSSITHQLELVSHGMTPAVLTDEEVTEAKEMLKDWERRGGKIAKLVVEEDLVELIQEYGKACGNVQNEICLGTLKECNKYRSKRDLLFMKITSRITELEAK